MDIQALIIWLIVGGVAGFLASMIMKSGGLRLTGNNLVDTIITGIIGAFIGGFLMNTLHISLASGLVGSIIDAVIGAIILIFALRALNR